MCKYFLLSVFVLVLAIVFGRRGAPSPPAIWAEGDRWNRFFKIYDSFLVEMYSDCESRVVTTSFGKTATFACGDRSRDPVLFLHGAASSSFIYGDWILPELRQSHYAVAVDFVCDIGRSIPRDGNINNCPQNRTELVEWVRQIRAELRIDKKPISLVGYSYGAFIAATIAQEDSISVDKLVLIAPASVLAPVEFGWLLRALAYGLFYQGSWFTKYMAADPNFDYERDVGTARHREMMDSINAISATALAVNPDVLPDAELTKIATKHRTLVVVGDHETVTNHSIVAETARRVGFTVDVVPKSGHLMLIEHPAREYVNERVANFLKQK